MRTSTAGSGRRIQLQQTTLLVVPPWVEVGQEDHQALAQVQVRADRKHNRRHS